MSNYDILKEYALNQNDLKAALKLAEWYITNRQYSAAFTYYMKCAELCTDEQYTFKYHCLMMISWIYKIEGNRWLGAIQYARFAKAEQPDRPEAYTLLCNLLVDKLYAEGVYEQGEWIQVYENARIGLMYAKVHDQPVNIYYGGIEYLEAYYAISLLRLNKLDELKQFLSETEFTLLNDPYIMNTIIYIYNELRLWCPYTSYHIQNNSGNLRLPFNNLEKIPKNYSQAMQDMFVLTALDGKLDGTYLEIGSADPTYGNNTKLLEQLGWKGLSIDYNSYFVNQFTAHRDNPCLCLDALNTDYKQLFKTWFGSGVNVIDYLSLDIDPAENTLECLYRLPLDTVRFSVITFEHDSYQSGDTVRDQSRELLHRYGYQLVGKSIKFNLQDSYEDWYIHESAVSEDRMNSLIGLFEGKSGILSKIFYK